ncbi:HNH endonuclease signature motif containing protein [Allopusillimonas ginsengisoli]|uniref:HNH endonuclease signature motif containing protein n=1 Tax=Allopusillimonas ginsengisoli TaxID=453575 RepID=UPI00101F9250|nr:HNH endonuclease signature motif containing protein [Allopusillimonas ginsengisoli]TEA79826.1 HNH endonuclease [Allopusillimonas ginsengisoli]
MARLRMLKPTLPMVSTISTAKVAPSTRMTGRKLQDRRLRIWSASPYCAGCGRLTLFPNGFELDHKVALFEGGPDTDGNCQILCVYIDDSDRKAGCHVDKTAQDLGFKR